MAEGGGKYRDACEVALKSCGVGADGQAGGLILIVINGNQGHGFECQGDIYTMKNLPNILDQLASDLRADAEDLATGEAVLVEGSASAEELTTETKQ